MLVSIYCSGSIIKGSGDTKRLCWTDAEKQDVQRGADPHEVFFLNPDDPITSPDNTLGQFGRDMFQIMIATAVVVDARERRGLGIGVEMAAAVTYGKPVVVVAPPNSKYRLDVLEYRGTVVTDYVHPHVASLATAVVDNFVEAGAVLASVARDTQRTGRFANDAGDCQEDLPYWLTVATEEYQANVLPGDTPMQEALERLQVHLSEANVGTQ